jgi:hypothetical protein
MLVRQAASSPVQYVSSINFCVDLAMHLVLTSIPTACEKAVDENKLPDSKCACGKRAEGMVFFTLSLNGSNSTF